MITVHQTLALILALLPTCATATYVSDAEESKVDIDVAATIAMLFVWANIGETEWNKKTNIDSVIPMYNNDNKVSAYCINLKNGNTNAGYIVVSTNLYEPLIQEYSDTMDLIIKETLNAGSTVATHPISKINSRVYYYAPLYYGTVKKSMPKEKAESNDASQINYQNSAKYISAIKQYGLLPYSSSQSRHTDVGIIDPIEYLESLYPDATITNAGYYNIGDNSIFGYDISEQNACSVYGVAAILHYYLKPAYTFSEILTSCERIARDEGYATFNSTTRVWDYYIDVGYLAPFARKCAAEYSLNKTISSSLLSWSTGTSEISNGRPILLNIWLSGQYHDHTVTAFAWTRFLVSGVGTYLEFFKVKDGYVAGNRYVCYQTVTGSYITKFV